MDGGALPRSGDERIGTTHGLSVHASDVDARVRILDLTAALLAEGAVTRASRSWLVVRLAQAMPFLSRGAMTEWAASAERERQVRALLSGLDREALAALLPEARRVHATGGLWAAQRWLCRVAAAKAGADPGGVGDLLEGAD